MPPAIRPTSKRFDRRRILAGSAVGLAAAGLAALLPLRLRSPSGFPIEDPDLAGPQGDVWLGSPQAAVTLVEYAALTCPHCAAFHDEAWPAVRARWVDTGQVRFALRCYPLNPLDIAGFMLARADGGRTYYPVTDLLFEKQSVWALVPNPLGAMRDLLQRAGIGRERFEAVLRDQALYDAVRRVHAQATSVLGVHSTPTLFVDGRRHEGAASADALGDSLARAVDARRT